jgi:spore coat polysaccharide biosynthesis predicted glycosyltransferase SpsG
VRWGFRVATDRRSGAGHLARCRALAVALDRNAVLFCDPDDNERLGWPTPVVGEPELGSTAIAVAALRDQTVQALIVDSYAVKDAAVNEAAHAGFVAAFRDTLPYGPEAISINPNPGYAGSETILAGPAYMPLPADYVQLNEKARGAARPQPDSLVVLVAFGARDSANRTMMALEALAAHSRRLHVRVALGADAVHADLVTTTVGQLDFAEILPEHEDLAATYDRFDLAVGAPGVSQFERACCGVPTILVPQNERQESLTRAWAKTTAAVYSEPTPATISRTIAALLDDQETILTMRERGLELVDGKGAIRLADALKKKAAG